MDAYTQEKAELRASKFLGYRPEHNAYIFELVPHPDALSHYAIDEAGVTSIIKRWDGASGMNKYFDGGSAPLYLPVEVLTQIVDYFSAELPASSEEA